MPSRLQARQRLPLACALSCVLLAALAASLRMGGDRTPPRDPRLPTTPPIMLGEAAPSGPAGGDSGSRPDSPRGKTSAPRWASGREAPAIPWQAIQSAAAGEAGEIGFTFDRGRLATRAVVRKIEKRSEANYTLMGDLPGTDGTGSWTLTRKDAIVVANFRLPDAGPYIEWRVNPEGAPVEQRILADLLPPCESSPANPPALADLRNPVMPPPEAPDATVRPPFPPPDLGDDPPTVPEIAVMVVYTPAAVAAVGGPSAMEALVYLALDETNAALADSRATPRLRLVHHQELPYTETMNTIRTDLERLRTPDDGYLDEVGALRDLVGADLVSMIVVNDVSCGRAYTLVSNPATFSSYAFSVVAHDCVATNYSFSHEIAHNLGCQHAVGDDNGSVVSGNGIFPDSHGWRFEAASPEGTLYRTIMAQSPGRRVAFYSNPGILVAGAVAGDPAIGNCVRTINAIGPMATQWRNTPETLYGDAVGQPEWIFQSGGDAPWTVQPIERRDGRDALQVGLVPDNGTSWLQTIREGPVELEFFWKLSSDDPGSALAVSVDGVEYGRILGGNGWRRQSVRLATGSHVVRWTQTRGNAGDSLGAIAWIDSISASGVPFLIHDFATVGVPVEEVLCRFESIPFQDYLLEMSTDFLSWRPARPITPTIPAEHSTEVRFALPMEADETVWNQAAFRIRMLE